LVKPKRRARNVPRGERWEAAEVDLGTVGEVLDGRPTCSLDVAEETAGDKVKSMAEVGVLMGIGRERVRQIEMLEAAPKLRDGLERKGESFKVQRGHKTTSRLLEPTPLVRKGARFFYPDDVKVMALGILAELGSGISGLAAAGEAVEEVTGQRPGHGTLRAWRRAAHVRP
jgi:hypothetical protein